MEKLRGIQRKSRHVWSKRERKKKKKKTEGRKYREGEEEKQ